MRQIPTKVLRSARRAGVIAVYVATVVPAAHAASVSRAFEFGPGTPNATSNVRTFPVPCGLEVAAVVKFRKLGSGKVDIPIEIELREPDTAPGVEGPVVETRFARASTVEQTEILRSLASNRGCAKPWRVRVKFKGTGPVPAAVFGTARLDYDGRTTSLATQTPGFIGKRKSGEANIGGTTGFDQGRIEITANWNHMIGPIPGPNPIKFMLQLGYLIDNNPGNMMIGLSSEAYSSNETRGLTKFKFVYNIRERARGQWKLWVRNLENDHDAFMFAPTATFTPVCP